ncbi:MAG: cytochrome C biogenesis protein CcmH [Proteobacteria bacterium]|nr:MAG: cytochrome C biogenesis protein CcmH [Pseudomonadota bacterium]
MRRLALILAIVVYPLMALAVGVDEARLSDPALEARARDLMKELRCLVCQNQSIDESDADLAKDLRHIVRERIAAGDSDAAVRRYLVDRYGDWVLLDPPMNARMMVLWLAPLGLVVVAATTLIVVLRRRRREAAAPLTAEEEKRLRAILSATDEEAKRP